MNLGIGLIGYGAIGTVEASRFSTGSLDELKIEILAENGYVMNLNGGN